MPKRLYEATYGRLMAAGYDRVMRDSERAGLAQIREDLLANARGATLEIGGGTGINLAYYPHAVTRLVLTEPSLHMARRLRARVDHFGRPTGVVMAYGEHLPFPAASFDTVVVTLVLCTVGEVPSTLTETARVLRPGGRLLFLEHVRSSDARLAAWQDRWHGVWRFFGGGCHCNRATEQVIAACFDVEEITYGEVPKAPAIVRPLITGVARARAVRSPTTGSD